MIPVYSQCEYCSKTFVNEKNLIKHQENGCDFKERYDNIVKTASGRTMYNLYLFWLRSNGRTVKYVDRHTFIHSIHYKAFERFIDFAKKNSLPNKKTYIKVCNQFKLSPRDWTKDNVYTNFMDVYDEWITPNKQFEQSIDTIFTLSEALEIKPSEVFEEVDARDISLLIRSRKISPWFFLNSQKFRDFMVNRASAADREHIHKYTNPKKWKEIFAENPKKRKSIAKMIKQLGL